MKLRKRGASAQAGPEAHGIAAAEGRAASAIAPSGLAMGFHPLRDRCRDAGRWISSGDGRVLQDACRQSGAGLCQPYAVRDGAVEKLWPVLQPGDRLVVAQRYLAVLLWLTT